MTVSAPFSRTARAKAPPKLASVTKLLNSNPGKPVIVKKFSLKRIDPDFHGRENHDSAKEKIARNRDLLDQLQALLWAENEEVEAAEQHGREQEWSHTDVRT